jgi:hypothetical protein
VVRRACAAWTPPLTLPSLRLDPPGGRVKMKGPPNQRADVALRVPATPYASAG